MPPTLWARLQAAIAAFRNRTPPPPPPPAPDLSAALARIKEARAVASHPATVSALDAVQNALTGIANRRPGG